MSEGIRRFDPDEQEKEGRGGFNPACAACVAKRIHEPEEWLNHKFAGHGFTPDTGWTPKENA